MQQTGKTDATPNSNVRGQATQNNSADLDLKTRLEQIRDEIKLNLHLAGMDAKEAWGGLEVQLEDALRVGKSKVEAATQLATETRDNAQGTLEDLLVRAQLFKESLDKARGH